MLFALDRLNGGLCVVDRVPSDKCRSLHEIGGRRAGGSLPLSLSPFLPLTPPHA